MKSDPLTGPLYIGTGQTDNLSEIVKMMKLFQERYPHVQFHLLSDDKEKLLKQLERNLLDFGLFIHDYDRNLYEGIPLKSTNSLDILAFKVHPSLLKKSLQKKILKMKK
ncbi:LysR substrate-binding domain-containing protein [Faecalibacillus intestinalis]|uniref:LysR substrate-binding domain-containing protein n=1 Tax=Faecalibacillus intestinalis TaxID=1982626 RepID=UPI0022E07A1B|nr:LysR substrate-binding domain-containing protein [Faecalibacillus intestinalis]